jgi:hypothetical protein
MPKGGELIMKRIMTAFLAVAILVAFTAPSFAGEKKEEKEKKGGKLVQLVYGEEKKEEKKKGGK